MAEEIGYKQTSRLQLEREEHRKHWLYSEADLQSPASTKRRGSSGGGGGGGAAAGPDSGKRLALTLDEERELRDQAVGHIQHVVKDISRMKQYCDHVHAGTMATAAMFLHRFYMEQSFLEVAHIDMAICCIYVAMKIDRKPKGGTNSSSRTISDLINITLKYVFEPNQVDQLGSSKLSPSVVRLQDARSKKQKLEKKKLKSQQDESTIRKLTLSAVEVFREELCYNECLLLSTLGFNTLEVRLPITYIVHYINVINIVATKREKFIDQACKQLNSIQGATFGLLYHPELIACCMIQRAARLLDIALPEPKHSKLAGRTWIHAVLLAKEAPLLLHGDTEPQDPSLLVDKLNTAVDTYIAAQKKWLQASHSKGPHGKGGSGSGGAPPPPSRRASGGGGGGSASSPRRSRRKSSSDFEGGGSEGGGGGGGGSSSSSSSKSKRSRTDR